MWNGRLANKSHLALVKDNRKEYNEERAQALTEARERGEEITRFSLKHRRFGVEMESRVGELVKRFTVQDVQNSMRTVAAMLDGRTERDSPVGDLRVLLRHARNFGASDARDKVYAFVGLAREGYGSEPSYSQENSPLRVYSDAARKILEHDEDLSYILEQAFAGRGDLGYFLPSWIPDWNYHEDRSVFPELQQHADKANDGDDSSRASGNVGQSNEKKLDVDFQGHDIERPSLRIMGRRIATLGRKYEETFPKLRQFETNSEVVVYAPITALPGNEI